MAYSLDLRVRVVGYAGSVKGGQKKAAAFVQGRTGNSETLAKKRKVGSR